MKSIITLIIVLISMQSGFAAEENGNANVSSVTPEQELLNLSKQKWQWMADKNADALDDLFHDKAVFVHMGATMTKEQELNTIRSGGIHYKHADIEDTSVRFIENTAIILDKMRLTAVVGGNEVVNPFTVTEVYVRVDGKWKLGSLSFTRLLGD